MSYAANTVISASPAGDLESVSIAAYLGLGANLGDPAAALKSALRSLEDDPNISVQAVSSLYRTAPIGLTEQPDFFNAVARIETRLSPEDLLAAILRIEMLLGRVRTERWMPRVIDIDVLLYGDRTVSTPTVTIPHPRMFDRAFVLVPLVEIAPELKVPHLVASEPGETVAVRARLLAEDTRIIKVSF